MDVPQPYKNAAMCNIVGGLFNIAVNGLWALSLISSCVGIVVVPLPAIVMAIGAWQAWVGLKMNNGERVENAAMVALVGAVVGFFSLSWLSTGLGVFSYLQAQDAESVAYLQG